MDVLLNSNWTRSGLRLARIGAGLSVALMSGSAMATIYVWSGGDYNPGVTSPNPLAAEDVLRITGSGSLAAQFNSNGMVEWQGGDVTIKSGGHFINGGVVTASGNNAFIGGVGGGALTNNGAFRKSSGAGVTRISGISFYNSGTIQADTGTIEINGNNSTFNTGSKFVGLGRVDVKGAAQFGSSFTSDNLNLVSGTFSAGNSGTTFGGKVALRGGTLTGLNGKGWTVGDNASLDFYGATIGTSLATNATGTINWLSGDLTFANAAKLTNAGTINVSNGGLITGSGSVTNSGTVAWSGGDITLTGAAQISSSGTLNASGNGIFTINSGSYYDNSGTIKKTAGTGTTKFVSPGVFYNSGTIQADTGTIEINGNNSTFNTGSKFVGLGRVDVKGAAQFGSSFTSDNLNLVSGTFSAGNSGTTFGGKVALRGGTLTGLNGKGWTVGDNASLDFYGATIGTSLATNATGTINWLSGDLTFANAAKLTNAGTINVSNGGLITGSGSVTNSGTVAWSGGDITLTGAAQISSSGTLNASGNGIFTINSGSYYDNSGTIKKTAGTGTTKFVSPGVFYNSGTIQADTGTIEINGNNSTFNTGSKFVGLGRVDVKGAAQFGSSFTSDNLNLVSGTFSAGNSGTTFGGKVALRGGTLTGLNGKGWTVGDNASLDFYGATIGTSLATNATGTINWLSGDLTFANAAKLTNAGTINVSNGGLITGSGSNQLINSGTIRKTGRPSVLLIGGIGIINTGTIQVDIGSIEIAGSVNTFNAGSAFVGAGRIYLTQDATFNGAFSSQNLNFVSGTFTGHGASMSGSAVIAGGSLTGDWRLASGAGLTTSGPRSVTISGTFANEGALQKSSTGDLLLDAATFTNDGHINLTAGDLKLLNGSSLINDGRITLADNTRLVAGDNAPNKISNNGIIEKVSGNGVATLGAGLENHGLIDVRSGTIVFPGAFLNDGTLSGAGTFATTSLRNFGVITPNSDGVGQLMIDGNLTQESSSWLLIQLANGGVSDLLTISGTTALGGSLKLSCNSCRLRKGDAFKILTSVNGLSGTFATIDAFGLNLAPRYSIQVSYDRLNGIVYATILQTSGFVPEPASWGLMLFGFAAVGTVMRRKDLALRS